MTMQVRQGGAWREITGAKVFASGSWRTLVGIKVYSGGQYRDVANFVGPSFDLTTSGDFERNTRLNVATQTVSATPTAGLAPYTYSWAVISQIGSAGTVSIPLPSASTTSVRCAFATYGTVDCTIRVTVTDSLGTVATADLAGSFTKLEPIDTGGPL